MHADILMGFLLSLRLVLLVLVVWPQPALYCSPQLPQRCSVTALYTHTVRTCFTVEEEEDEEAETQEAEAKEQVKWAGVMAAAWAFQ
jgi:hypothetical protein